MFFRKIIRIFDFSSLASDSPNYEARTLKKVVGKFKDEAAGNQITHFVGLRPKLSTFKVKTKYKKDEKGKVKEINAIEEDKRKAKGVKKNVIKKSFNCHLKIRKNVFLLKMN